MGRKIYIKRCVLGTYEAELKRMLVRYPVKIFVKGGRHQPVKLSNKGGKYLTSSGLGVRPLY